MGGYHKAHRKIHGKDTAFKLLMVQLEPSPAIEDEVQQLRREGRKGLRMGAERAWAWSWA